MSKSIYNRLAVIALIFVVGAPSTLLGATPAEEKPIVSSPSGHKLGDGKGIENSVDGDKSTKWCIEFNGNPSKVIWLTQLPKETPLKAYSLTSGNDVPERDPQDWVLEGSKDGLTWIQVDKQKLDRPFEDRGMTKTFSISKPAAYSFYRFTFNPPAGVDHFQVAEITLDGIILNGATIK